MRTQKARTTHFGSSAPLAKQKGLDVHRCECGATVWAFPWNDEQAAWEAHLKHPLRSYIEENGLAAPEPRVSPHVIIADAEDGDLLRSRRWRVFPSKPWMPHKFEVRGGEGRALALHQHVMGGEQWVEVANGNGCDLRRENLRRLDYQAIGELMRVRKAACARDSG